MESKTHSWVHIDGTPCHHSALETKCARCGTIRMRDGRSTIYIKGKKIHDKAPKCK